ncbi:hypothetical protein NEAUS03_1828 [Nematocida ausubeli]|nr:hypothetical protein NEAUS03_1828 [Nematocida ausubeli]
MTKSNISKRQNQLQLQKKSFFSLQKMISRLILTLIMMQNILTKISVEDINKAHEFLVGERQDVVINPKGPLNLLRGYIVNRSEFMHNKRFYSSEIDTDYALSKERVFCRNQYKYIYKFTRKPVNDRVYKDLDTKTPEGKYLSTYHAQLIKMFPSADRNLSIEAGRPNALTNFLRANHIKKDTKYILAALLLLSEGVDIKINVDHTGEKKRLVIKSKTCKEKEFVNVEMYIAGIDPVTKEHSESIYQSEAAEIVNFYIRSRDNPLLKKGGEFAVPTTKEEFESGKFLNSAAFLIQTYIYEFVDTLEEYQDFLNAVYELLIDQVPGKGNSEDTKKKGKKSRVFNDLFLAEEAFDENIKYIASFWDLIKTKNEEARFPFYNSSQLPKYTRVPRYKLDKTGFELDESLNYSNCVESALLGLFCCLAYNPEAGEYETDHMEDKISDELRGFFEKYPKPTNNINIEMHKEWCKVVACLDNDDIDYKQSKNELISGIANIFLVIAEITGQKEEALELVEHIKAACKNEKLDEKATDCIANGVKSIITSLSKNKNVKVNCEYMQLMKRSNDKPDISLIIKISYVFDGAENGVALDVNSGHSNIDILSLPITNSEQIKEKYKEVKSIYNKADSYTGYMVTKYVEERLKVLRDINYDILDDYKNSIKEILQDGSESISKIFLLEKLTKSDIKVYIMEQFIACTIDKEIAATNAITCFTANILGGSLLYDTVTRRKMVQFFPMHTRWQEYYPKLGFKLDENLPNSDITNRHSRIEEFLNAIVLWPAPITVKALCNYFRVSIKDAEMVGYLLKNFISAKSLFNHIVDGGAIDNLVKFHSLIKDSEELALLNSTYISWFVYTCVGEQEFSPEFIKTVYSFILFDNLPSKNELESFKLSTDDFEKCLNVLEEIKTLLCSENDAQSKENYDKLVSYFKIAIS